MLLFILKFPTIYLMLSVKRTYASVSLSTSETTQIDARVHPIDLINQWQRIVTEQIIESIVQGGEGGTRCNLVKIWLHFIQNSPGRL